MAYLPPSPNYEQRLLGPAGESPKPAVFAPQWSAAAAAPPNQLFEFWRVIHSNLGWICLLTLLGAALGWGVAMIKPAIYQARAVLDIRSLNENFLNPREGSPMGSTTGSVLPESYLQTEIKILQSDSLRKRALDKIPSPKKMFGGNKPEPSSFWRSALGLLDPVAIPRKQLLSEAAGKIKVRALGNTRIVEIICDARDAQVAADVCNSLARTYIEYNVESRYLSTKETGEWLQSQLDEVRRRLTKAEAELKDAAKESAVDVDSEGGNLAQERLRQLQADLSRSQAERMTKESDYQIAAGRPAESLPQTLDSGPLRDYRMRLAELKRQLAELSFTMTPEHYRVRELKMQIAAVETALLKEQSDFISRLRADYEAARNRESLFANAYQKQAMLVGQHGPGAIRYMMLKRDVDTERKLYETLLQKVNEVGIATALRTSTISVVDPAVPAARPYSPNQLVSVALGLFGGACVGFVFSFVRLRSDRTLRNPGETPFPLQLRELGVIPSARVGGLRSLLNQASALPAKVSFRSANEKGPAAENSLTRSSPVNPIELATWLRNPPELAEAFGGAMNSLLFASGTGARSRIIVFTSPDVGDGKTTVATNLAIALAQIGQRVIIVDGDLRKPRLHQIFNLPVEGGLAKLLDGKDPIDQSSLSGFVYETQIQNLSVLPTAAAGDSVAAKLHSGRMRSLLERLRQEFDIVIIDSPPMLHLSDARVLGWLADGVLLVFRARKTTRDSALAAITCLRQDGIRVLGSILNDWAPQKSSTYGTYSSYLRAAS